MKAAGTDETFRLKFLYFDHNDQRWQAECQIGEVQVILAGAQGLIKWYVVGHPEVKVPRELCNLLGHVTHHALADYCEERDYERATGKPSSRVVQ